MNSSLLESESVFVPIDSSLNTVFLGKENAQASFYSSFDLDDVPPAVPSISEKIVMTEEQAMRLLHIAASLLQANIKRYFQQKRYIKMLKERHAASKIQALWRGYRIRNLNIKTQNLKYQFLCEKFKSFCLLEQKNMSLLTEAIVSLSSNVEELTKQMPNLATSTALDSNLQLKIKESFGDSLTTNNYTEIKINTNSQETKDLDMVEDLKTINKKTKSNKKLYDNISPSGDGDNVVIVLSSADEDDY